MSKLFNSFTENRNGNANEKLGKLVCIDAKKQEAKDAANKFQEMLREERGYLSLLEELMKTSC
jgi:hypothetical protein